MTSGVATTTILRTQHNSARAIAEEGAHTENFPLALQRLVKILLAYA